MCWWYEMKLKIHKWLFWFIWHVAHHGYHSQMCFYCKIEALIFIWLIFHFYFDSEELQDTCCFLATKKSMKNSICYIILLCIDNICLKAIIFLKNVEDTWHLLRHMITDLPSVARNALVTRWAVATFCHLAQSRKFLP